MFWISNDTSVRLVVQFVYSKVLRGDLQGIVARLSAMKYSLQTDKPLTVLADDSESMQDWNDYYDDQLHLTGKPPSWYSSNWLYIECFFYRNIYESIALR